MAVVGITMVYFALTMLVAVLVVLSRMVDRGKEPRAKPTPPAAAPASPPETADSTVADGDARRLELVALAAYGVHLRRRVSVRKTVEPSPWSRAGRANQVMRFPGRG
jgi:Na+-transporting methylmalonyl-CoA/oxaloacetate decarboxylase gamma subunit